MILKKFYNNTALNDILTAIQSEEEQCYIGTSQEIVVLKGDSTQVDDKYCKKNNINVLPIPNSGGCTVIFPSDFCVAYLTKNVTSTIIVDFMNALVEYLKEHGINASVNGNDVVIDDKYKVASGSVAVFNHGNFAYFAIHTSNYVDLELIKNICLKPMVKIPRGLDEYYITTGEMEDLFVSLL